MDKKLSCIVLNAPECNWQNPHVTVYFLGRIADYREGMREEILHILETNFKDIKICCSPTGQDAWKVSNKSTAFPVISNHMDQLHWKLKKFLEPIGAKHSSKFNFNPHITTPNDKVDELPVYLELTPLQLWWGGKIYSIGGGNGTSKS